MLYFTFTTFTAKGGKADMLPCEMLFGEDEGKRMQDLVVRATGKQCPCKSGKLCPLMHPKAQGAVASSTRGRVAKAALGAGLLAASFAEGSQLIAALGALPGVA